MGNKKSSLSKVFLVIAIILIVVMGALLYMQKTEADRQIAELENNASKLQEAINNLQEKNDLITNTKDSKDIYEKCENKFSNVEYRRETGGSSGFFIKNGVLYSGEENLTETHSKTTGVEGKAKYVVPVNKQVFETIVLTEEGKLFINKLDSNGVYGNDFYSILKEYKILEIINIPNENGHLLLASDGKILKLDGTLYLDLLKEDNTSNETKNNFAVLELSPIGGTAVLYNGEVYVNVYDSTPNIDDIYGEGKYQTLVKTRESYVEYKFDSLTINNNGKKWSKLNISNVKAIYNNEYGQDTSSTNPKYGIIMLNEDKTVSYISISSLIEGKVETTKLNANDITSIETEDNMGLTTYLVDANGNKKDVNNYIK